MKTKKPKAVVLEAGEASSGRVWIGAPTGCYDEVTRLSGKLHILMFTVEQAKAAIEMLQDEIDRVESRDAGK